MYLVLCVWLLSQGTRSSHTYYYHGAIPLATVDKPTHDRLLFHFAHDLQVCPTVYFNSECPEDCHFEFFVSMRTGDTLQLRMGSPLDRDLIQVSSKRKGETGWEVVAYEGLRGCFMCLMHEFYGEDHH